MNRNKQVLNKCFAIGKQMLSNCLSIGKQLPSKIFVCLTYESKISIRKDKIYLASALSLIKIGLKQRSFLKENYYVVKEKGLKPCIFPAKTSIPLLKSCGKSFQQVFNNHHISETGGFV